MVFMGKLEEKSQAFLSKHISFTVHLIGSGDRNT